MGMPGSGTNALAEPLLAHGPDPVLIRAAVAAASLYHQLLDAIAANFGDELGASFGFMFSYMVTRPLKRACSASSLRPAMPTSSRWRGRRWKTPTGYRCLLPA